MKLEDIEKINNKFHVLLDGLNNLWTDVLLGLRTDSIEEEIPNGDFIFDIPKCPECGGYRMGEYMMHNDGCSKCITGTNPTKEELK